MRSSIAGTSPLPSGCVGAGAAFEPGEPVGVEQAAAVRGQDELLVAGAAVDAAEQREQPVPAGGGAFEGVLAVVGGAVAEAVGEGVDGVRAGVGVVVEREQAAFLGVQQEHQPHEDGDGGLVDLGGADVGGQQAGAVLGLVVGVEAAERRDEHLDDGLGLLGEAFGDLFLPVEALW